jgi:hypothetical protein
LAKCSAGKVACVAKIVKINARFFRPIVWNRRVATHTFGMFWMLIVESTKIVFVTL